MRLHRVVLRDFRGVTEREVRFAQSGITVIDGPNEVGKSSIVDALDMVLRLPDSSEARDVREAVPSGRDVGPYVEVEMSAGPYRFVLAKQWRRGRMTSLDILEPQRRQMSGREAHQWVQSTLDEVVDADLWAALRVTQGVVDGPVDVHTRSMAKVLDGAMGLDDTSGDEDLVELIGDERALYWTTTGRPRGERVELCRELADLDERHGDIAGQIADLADVAARVDELVCRRADLACRRGPVALHLDAARSRAAEVEAARRRRDDAAAAAEMARAAHRAADDAVGQRRAAVDDLAGAGAEVDKLAAELERSAAIAETASAQAAVAADRFRVVEAELAAVVGRVVAFEQARSARIDADRLTTLRDRIAEAQEASAASAAAAAELAALAVVDADTLRRIESASALLQTAQARLEGASTHVEIRALSEVSVEVDGVAHVLGGGDRVAAPVSAEMSIDVQGLLEVVVTPAVGTADVAARVHEAAMALEAACAEVSVANLDEARRVHGRRSGVERALAESQRDERRALGSSNLDDLRADVDRLAARLGAPSEAAAALVATADVDLDAALDAQRTERAALQTRRDDLAADLNHHRERVAAARLDDTALAGRIDQAQRQQGRLAERLASLRADVADAELEQATEAALAALQTAEMVLAGSRRAVEDLHPDDVEAELARLGAELESLEAQLGDVTSEIDRLQTRLDVSGEQGLAGALGEVDARREHVARRYEQIERRAEAALRLHDSVTAHRDAARRRYAAPFRHELERLGRIVFGDDLQFELDEALRIERRVVDGVALDVDQLSVGAREQLGLLARLACAAIVSSDGGAPVMFDDVLGHADPERVAAMGRALEAAGDDSQIIITTCTPERYAGIDATRVSLV
jgi:chromosome segregation ATPase